MKKIATNTQRYISVAYTLILFTVVYWVGDIR